MFVVKIVANEEQQSTVWATNSDNFGTTDIADVDEVKLKVGVLRIEQTF